LILGELQLERNLNYLQLSPELQIDHLTVCNSKFRTLNILKLNCSTNANCYQSLPSDRSSELRAYLVKLQFDHAEKAVINSTFLENPKSIGFAGIFHPSPPPL